MDKSIYDLVVDELVSRQKDVRVELSNRFRRTKPFRTQKVSNEELLYNYSQITPEMEMSLRQSMGEEAIDDYNIKMENLKRRRGNG